MSMLYCSTYPYLALKYGASVREPFSAPKPDTLGCGFRPGGNTIPPAPNGPLLSAHEKVAKLLPASVQLVPFSVLNGVVTLSVVAVQPVAAGRTTSLAR